MNLPASIFLLPFLSALAFCTPQDRVEAEYPDAEFVDQAIAFLDNVQLNSFATGVEYCGYFGRDENGAFIASKALPGRVDSCYPQFPDHFDVVASYHTHGTHSPDFDSEVPSVGDITSDVDEGVYGFISTPGGRIWLVDWETATARQICGVTCVSHDPNYDKRDVDPLQRSYTLDDLKERAE